MNLRRYNPWSRFKSWRQERAAFKRADIVITIDYPKTGVRTRFYDAKLVNMTTQNQHDDGLVTVPLEMMAFRATDVEISFL